MLNSFHIEMSEKTEAKFFINIVYILFFFVVFGIFFYAEGHRIIYWVKLFHIKSKPNGQFQNTKTLALLASF